MKQVTVKILLTLLLISNALLSQVEYFVQVNPATCSITIVDSLHEVKWISSGNCTFDKINRKYVFQGRDTSSISSLYTIDATNANIVSHPHFPGTNFSSFKHDNSTGILYGLNSITPNVNFISINPSNFNYTIINTINNVGGSSNATFDDSNHKFIFSATDSVGQNCLFSIDALTGLVISKPPMVSIFGLQFDNSSGNLYGLHWDNILMTEYFVSVSVTTGSMTVISSLPSVAGVTVDYPTFNEINKQYTFRGIDNSGNAFLYTIDATNGQIINSPPFFSGLFNLIETRYDNSNGNLYALHWGPYSETSEIKSYSLNKDNINVYPNPTSDQFFIEANTTDKLTVDLYDVNGRHLFSKSVSDKSNINVTTLDEGVYTMTIKSVNRVTNKKLVILH